MAFLKPSHIAFQCPGSGPSSAWWTSHFMRASCCCWPDSPSGGGLLQCLAVSSSCPTRLAVFSYGSSIFRFDCESSISLRVMSGLVYRLQGLRACSCFTESNVLVAPIVSFTRYKWFNAAESSGAQALAASSARNLAAPRLRSPLPQCAVFLSWPLLGVQNSSCSCYNLKSEFFRHLCFLRRFDFDTCFVASTRFAWSSLAPGASSVRELATLR